MCQDPRALLSRDLHTRQIGAGEDSADVDAVGAENYPRVQAGKVKTARKSEKKEAVVVGVEEVGVDTDATDRDTFAVVARGAATRKECNWSPARTAETKRRTE